VEERIATVRPISEEAATGKVAEVFADIKRTKRIKAVPNFWRVVATNPEQLEILWTRLKAIMHPEETGRIPKLDPLTREIIALAVSATNNCAY
jgi:alkylhydroperoxidase family enzyme